MQALHLFINIQLLWTLIPVGVVCSLGVVGISKLPSYKALQAEIETLIQEKNSGYNDYRAKREEYRRLQTVKGNIDQILHRERKPVKRQEQER